MAEPTATKSLALARDHLDRASSAAIELPDISDLLVELNTARKAHAYGDVEAPDLDEQELAEGLDSCVDAVAKLVAK